MKARTIAAWLERLVREFPVTTVTGLRQSGKTTLVRSLPGRTYVTLDDLGALEAARRDPAGFVAGLPRPVTIDEAQRVPELLLPIKREVDSRRRPGQFLLTGSARIELKRGVQETLAGRGAIARLRPMTWSEAAGRAEWNAVDELFQRKSAAAVLERFARGAALEGARVLRGGLPVALLGRNAGARVRWLEQYRAAYVERDVPPLVQLDDLPSFLRYLGLAAARTAQLMNYSAIGRDAGVATDTSVRWMGVLEATFLADELPPYFRNVGKRLVKSPRLHLGDVGVAAELCGVRTWPDALRFNLAGPFLETLVAQHLFAFAETAAQATRVFHWRTHAGAEVDFVLERGSRLLPVEVKLTSTPGPSDARGVRAFRETFPEAAQFGVVLHAGENAIPLADGVVAVPLSIFLAGA
jgi:predicted AAA+ superfamily ATPase